MIYDAKNAGYGGPMSDTELKANDILALDRTRWPPSARSWPGFEPPSP